ncbi:MAG: hypothetical protein QXF76_04130 [Candidatus Anstonellales archaeon]
MGTDFNKNKAKFYYYSTIFLMLIISLINYAFHMEKILQKTYDIQKIFNETNITIDLKDTQQTKPKVIIYYGETCSYCKELFAYINANKFDEKLEIIHKEVYKNQTNANELISKAKECNIDFNNLAVPFLYHEGKCFIGSDNCIKYLDSVVKG